MVEQTQRVEVIAVDTPIGELDEAGVGICVGIGPIDVVVGTGHTGVDSHIVGKALTLVLEDVVESMDIGGVLTAEGAGGRLVETGIEIGGVVIDANMSAEGVDPDARRGEGCDGSTI